MTIRVRARAAPRWGSAAALPALAQQVEDAVATDAAAAGKPRDADLLLGEDDEEVRTWLADDAADDERELATDLHASLVHDLALPDGGIWAAPLDELGPLGRKARCRVDLPPAARVRRSDGGEPPAVRALAAGLLRWLRGYGTADPACEPPGLEDARPLQPTPAAAPPAPPPVEIWHEVPLVPQVTGMSCWAAAAAMIVGWRECLPVNPEALARGAGRWQEYRIGLLPDDLGTLCRTWGLVAEPPVPLGVPRLRDLLERWGPLWIGEADPGLHVVVVVGMSGDGTPGGTLLRVADPWPIARGERYTISYAELHRNFHAVTDVAGVNARILHSKGLGGASRVVRGPASNPTV
jgi:hypothetical protein